MGNCVDAFKRDGYFKDLKFLIGDLSDSSIFHPAEDFMYILAKQHLDYNKPDQGANDNNKRVYTNHHTPSCRAFVVNSYLAETGDTSRGPAHADLFEPLTRKRPLYCYQTFVSWKSKADILNPFKCIQRKRKTIYVQPIGPFPEFLHDANIFMNLEKVLENFFWPLDIIFLPEVSLEHSNWCITKREHSKTKKPQLLASSVYRKLSSMLPGDGLCIVGITWTDLYPSDDYSFVLGESSAQHKAGVFSFGRFEPKKMEHDGQTKDVVAITPEVVWKLLKVATHEICHIFVMDHCFFFKCAMNESTSVDEAMSQPFYLCPVCLRKLQTVCHFNVLDRYRLLKDALWDISTEYPYDKLEDTLAWLEKCINYMEDQIDLCRELKTPILERSLLHLLSKGEKSLDS